jgi:hypothetical protein
VCLGSTLPQDPGLPHRWRATAAARSQCPPWTTLRWLDISSGTSKDAQATSSSVRAPFLIASAWRYPALSQHTLPDLNAGHSFLPHGSCRNDSSRPRMMQLITMFPWDSDSTFKSGYLSQDGNVLSLEEERERRVMMWKEGLHLASFDSDWDPAVDRYRTSGFVSAVHPLVRRPTPLPPLPSSVPPPPSPTLTNSDCVHGDVWACSARRGAGGDNGIHHNKKSLEIPLRFCILAIPLSPPAPVGGCARGFGRGAGGARCLGREAAGCGAVVVVQLYTTSMVLLMLDAEAMRRFRLDCNCRPFTSNCLFMYVLLY